MSHATPPRLARWLLARRLGDRNRDEIIGDLDEEYRRHMLPERGALRARWWYWRQAVGSMPWIAGRRSRIGDRSNGTRLESVFHDLRRGLRRLRRAPGATAVSVATFALGVGLTTATFSVVDHALLRPLPFQDSGELVALHSVDADGASFPWVSATNWMDWQEQNRTLESSAIYSVYGSATVVTSDDAFTVPARYVSGDFFHVLRTPMLAGRPFTAEEARDREAVAVVSEGFWRRVLGADPELPRTLSISGRATRIIGVVRAGFEHPEGIQVWQPASYEYRVGGARNNINWQVVARLAPAGVTIEAARADLSRIADDIRSSDPAGIYSYGVGVYSLKEEVTGDAGDTLYTAMGCVLAVLLVSCANLAGLEFARRSARTHETAVRVALGASRWRVVQQGVLEQVTLALIGGALGTVLAWWGTAALLARYDLPVPRAASVVVDTRVLAFALLTSLLSGVVASLLPSLSAARTMPGSAIASARGTVRGGRNLPGALLVGVEVGVAVVLLVAGGLLARNFVALVGRDLGFDPDNVITADVALTAPRYREGPDARLQYWSAALETLRGTPGVIDVAGANPAPTGAGGRGFVAIEARPEVEAGADYRVVTQGYFELLHIPLLAGRAFDASDGAGSERVTIINRAMADTYWPGANPVGEGVRATSQEAMLGTPSLLIIGVAENVRQYGFADDPAAAMYVLHAQVPTHTGSMTLLARTAAAPDALVGTVRQQLRALDGDLAVDVRTLDARLGGRIASERLLTTTLIVFAVLGLTLAGIGIYGLLSFGVGQRTREIAVRMAIGARAGDVVVMVLRNALLVVAAGLVAGLTLAYAFSYLLAALLLDVPARDPITYFGVAATVLIAAVLAALAPALRAARRSPLDALR
ncbi:MAG: ADOP family duplicated permease [Acidobacteriota bacterium]